MPRKRARQTKAGKQSQIAVAIFVEGEKEPVEVLLEPAPKGFPAHLLPHLADYMARGFNINEPPSFAIRALPMDRSRRGCALEEANLGIAVESCVLTASARLPTPT